MCACVYRVRGCVCPPFPRRMRSREQNGNGWWEKLKDRERANCERMRERGRIREERKRRGDDRETEGRSEREANDRGTFRD